VKALKDQAQNIPGRIGSSTFDRLATESILGAILSPRFAEAPLLHPVKRALGPVYSGADNAVSDRPFEVLQDPQLPSALMKKATAGNVKMAEPLLRRLARSAVPGVTSPERGAQ
jgi:hypothetical protein